MMKEVPNLLPASNGELHDFEISYVDRLNVDTLMTSTNTYTVRQSKSVKNALGSFSRAVPEHGPIKSIRKVVPQ